MAGEKVFCSITQLARAPWQLQLLAKCCAQPLLQLLQSLETC
jgi:hypothetical protein